MAYELEDTAHAMADVLAAATVEELADRYLNEISAHVDSFAQGVYLHPDGPDSPSFIDVRGLGTFYTHKYEKHGRPNDPVVNTAIASGRVVDSSLISSVEWEKAAAVKDVFLDHDMGHLLCAPFFVKGELAGTLNLARHASDAGFQEADRRRMSMVASLFSAGVSASRRLQQSRRDVKLFKNALDHCGVPLIVTDLHLVERRPNLAAERLLETLRNPWTELGPALDGPTSNRQVSLTTVHDQQIEVLVNSLHLPMKSALLSLLQPLGPAGIVPNGIADLLTTREIEIASAVAAGLRDLEVAQMLNISPHTVKHHLKSVYRKLDVHSRVELVWQLQADI